MNKKTKRLLISLLIVLVIWGINFVVNQFNDGAANVATTQQTTAAVAPTANRVTTEEATETATIVQTSQSAPTLTTSTTQQSEVETIDDLVALGLLSEVEKNGKVIGWQSPAGLFYGMGSKEGNRVNHVFAHLEPNPDKPIHSVFDTDKAGLIILIDEAWQGRADAYSKVQGNGNRVYDVDMGRVIGTADERLIRLVLRDGTVNIITAYPKK